MNRRLAFGILLILLSGLGVSQRVAVAARQRPSVAQTPPPLTPPGPGSTTTVLPDGRSLIVGGERTESRAWLRDPQGRTLVSITAGPQAARAWHTATLLADGTVLLLGGRNGNALVETPEVFDPATGVFTSVPVIGAIARARHTATLLTDGRVLVVGGTDGGSVPLPTQLWDLEAHTATTVGADAVPRVDHLATLMADGRVLLTGGNALDGARAETPAAVDPSSGALQAIDDRLPPRTPLMVAGSRPAAASDEVPLNALIAVRFSTPAVIESITPDTLSLTGPDGPVTTRIIVAEGGRLAFAWPATPLKDASEYTVHVSGITDQRGGVVVPASITFTTKPLPLDPAAGDPEAWMPDAADLPHGWRANRAPSSWESMAPLMAGPGVTAISGRALTLDGRPLPNVTLQMEGATATSDRTGRFLLVIPVAGGRQVLAIHGDTASKPARTYGFFEYGMTVVPGQTNVLAFTIWMPKLDERHVVRIPSPTQREVVITTPYIPGLELHIPPDTVIRGEDGQPVTELGITAIPIDRPPFPLAKNVDVPVYFTVQPGGGYVYTSGAGPKGAFLVYPNYRHGVPGQRVQFFHYDPDVRDWYVYGLGTVTRNAAQVVPDPATRLYAFTGAMINGADSPPDTGGQPGSPGRRDPIDPATGVFLMHKTDLALPDVLPLALTRTYNSGDNLARSFGRGMVNPYAMFLWSANQYQEADLILPEGGKIHYVRTSAGTGFADAVFAHTTTPTPFYQSTLVWNGDGWDLTLTDGTVYVFGENAPLQAIRDRYGNQVTIAHATGQTGNITRVTSPNGRWIAFTYDGSDRITQAADNIGRTVAYTYDANGNLSTVTDPESNVTTYTYGASNQLATIKDGRNIVYLTNVYTNGRVTQQTLADPSAVSTLSYTSDGSGNITQTDITDPLGHVERLAFNSDHYVTSDIEAYGTALARTTTTTRQAGSNLVTAAVDGLSRRTEYTYDSGGHVLTTTRLATTADAVTTTYTYEPHFFQLATATDPLSHMWTIGYDVAGRPTSAIDPLSQQTTMTYNAAAQVTSVTDPLSHAWQFGYTDGDLTSTTSPLGGVASQFLDGGGRRIAATDPMGRVTRTMFDRLSRITSSTDPLAGQTTFSYDANSNMLSLTDALSHATSYTYDTSDRAATRTDPLANVASYGYDLNSNLIQATDRKSQVTGNTYDALDQLTQVTFQDSSTIAYTYDAGGRLTQIVDSINGTITRTYDDLDRLTAETTAEGTVAYTYDAAGRRTTMTVAGQTAVSYTYDNANRLTAITQGAATVSLAYDSAGRRNTLSYPDGIVTTYAYDNANQLTSLTYMLGTVTLGDLTYAYDAAGHRTSVGGSWARTGIPASLTDATYNAGNQLTAWDSTSFSYDLNGNLASDGPTSYTWNTRNQLTALSGGTSASFAYDSIGRRRGKTVSGTTTNFLYDGLNFVQELTSGGTPTANLLTGLGIDETFTRTDSTGTGTLLVDALGSILELADASGTLQTHYTFEPFGATATTGASSANATQFTGRENDGTGLYSYRARFYSPTLQRFIGEDPIGLAGGINAYTYVNDQPTGAKDPLGLQAMNLTPYPWFGKPEHGETPVCIDPGQTYPDALDGVASPWGPHPGDVFKNPDYTGVVILPGGTPIIVFPGISILWPEFPLIIPPGTTVVPPIPGFGSFPGWGWIPGPWMHDHHPDWDPLILAGTPGNGGSAPGTGRKDPPKKCPA